MSAELATDSDGYRMWMNDVFSADDEAKTNCELWKIDKRLLNRYCTQFNCEIDTNINRHGEAKVANAIWFIYSCASSYMHDVLDFSLGQLRIDFMMSVKILYAKGFDRHCVF